MTFDVATNKKTALPAVLFLGAEKLLVRHLFVKLPKRGGKYAMAYDVLAMSYGRRCTEYEEHV